MNICDHIPPRTRANCNGFYELETGKPAAVCVVSGCQRFRGTGLLCSIHKGRLWKLRNPEHSAYITLKNNAKRRGKPFTLTLADWMELCRLTRYHEGTAGKTGNVKTGLTIDRINHREGYTLRNIRVITHSANASKGAGERLTRLVGGHPVLFEILPPDEPAAERPLTEDEQLDRAFPETTNGNPF